MRPPIRIVVLCALALAVAGVAGAAPRSASRGTPLPLAPHVLDLDRSIDLNRAIMPVVNNGAFAWDLATGAPGLIFPKGTTNTVVFASGLWLGCTVNGETRAVVAEYSQEYGPGSMIGVSFDNPNRPEYVVYKVVRFAGSPDDTAHVDRTPEELAAVPGLDPLAHHSWSEYMSGAAPFGAPWRIHRLPNVTTPDPTDSTDVPGPDVMGDQMLWCVFNDADQTLHTNSAGSSPPLGVEVQMTTFAFDRPGPLGNTVFVKYKIINKGNNILQDVYASTWSDPDVGGPSDDLVGFDLGRMMGYAYNATNSDTQYGSEPPAVGYTLLKGPTLPRVQSFNKYINGTDPASTTDTYNYMQGLLPNGSEVIDPTTGQATRYFVTGDPLAGTGWIDSAPADRRMLLSNGPFQLSPTDTAEMLVAIVIGQSQDRLASIVDLRCSADYVQTVADFNFQVFPPIPVDCLQAVNCPRDLPFWADKCPNGGGELTPDQLMIIATSVGQRSTYFDWNSATQQFCDLVSSGPGDIRHQAQQQYAALLANYEAGQIGIIPSSNRPIILLPYTPVSCAGSTAQNMVDLVATGSLEEGMRDALYFNDNATNRRPIEGVDAGLGFFNGGAGVATNFFGSPFDPATQPDSFTTVELRFSTTTTQNAYRYLRLEQQDGTAPVNGREYRYGGYHDVPFTAWDMETGQQLEVGFVERAVTDANGTILPDAFQVATFDSTWRPDDSVIGGREYLFIFKRVYGPLRAELTQDGIILNGTAPALYALWSRLRTPVDQFDDGDRFQWVWGVPANSGVDQQLLELEPQDLNVPAVSQAYAQIVDCLTAINNGIGIGPVCDDPTAVTASLISAEGQPDRALLTWAVGGERGIVATVERRVGSGAWSAIATASPDGSGRIVYEDRDVTAGARYGYRLAIVASGGPMWAGEAWVEIPSAWTLALGGFRPNPAGRGDLSIAFTLANGHRATLELYDVAGRRVFGREVGSLGPGNHLVRLDEARRLNPGVYLVRLEQDSRSIKTKAALLR